MFSGLFLCILKTVAYVLLKKPQDDGRHQASLILKSVIDIAICFLVVSILLLVFPVKHIFLSLPLSSIHL